MAFPVDHDRMVYFAASSYFFNTAGFVYHTAGVLLFEITDAMVRGCGTQETWVPFPSQPQASLGMSLSLSGPSVKWLNHPTAWGEGEINPLRTAWRSDAGGEGHMSTRWVGAGVLG